MSMRIKVKQKKGTYTSMVPGLLATTFFFIIGGGMFFGSLYELFIDFTFDNFIVVFSEGGIVTLFGLAFFLLSLYLLSFLFRGAKIYVAILKKIDIEDKNGKTIYNYEFKLKGNNDSVYNTYKCYTEEDYHLEIGKTYGLRIKQFNWKVKAIEEIDEGKIDYNKKVKSSDMTGIDIVCYVFFLIFGGGIVFILIKMVYDFVNGNHEFFNNIIGIIFCSIFFAPALYLYFEEKYASKSLKEKITFDKERISKKLKRLDEVKKITSNIQYNGSANVDLTNVTSFIASRALFNEQDNYEVIDDHYEEKLYKVVNEDEKYYLHDSIDCVVAEIKVDKNDDGVDILFVPVNGSSFAIYFKKLHNYGFKIVGKDYEIKRAEKSLILSDGNGVNVGTIQVEKNITFPRVKVEINNMANNEDIIMLCLGVVMIEYHYSNKSSTM